MFPPMIKANGGKKNPSKLVRMLQKVAATSLFFTGLNYFSSLHLSQMTSKLLGMTYSPFTWLLMNFLTFYLPATQNSLYFRASITFPHHCPSACIVPVVWMPFHFYSFTAIYPSRITLVTSLLRSISFYLSFQHQCELRAFLADSCNDLLTCVNLNVKHKSIFIVK